MKKLFGLFLGLAALSFGQSAGVGQIWTVVTGTLQSGATANGNGSTLAVQGLSAARVTVNCSVACSGGTTVNFEGSQDGTNYTAISGQQTGTATIATTVVNQSTTPTVWELDVAGLQLIRARISAYSAGTITVTATATAAPFNPKVSNANLFMAGTAADGNSGNKSAQTQRVVLATDQPNLTSALNVALAANQSVNNVQVNGTTIDTNSGNKSAGTQRVVLATDQPNLTSALNVAVAAGTNLIGSVVPYAGGTLASGAVTSAMTGTTSTSLIGATASNYIYVSSCAFSNDHASVDTTVLLQDGSGGTTLWKGMVPHGGGSNIVFPVPLKVPTVGNALFVQNVTTGSSTYAACNGFKSTVSY